MPEPVDLRAPIAPEKHEILRLLAYQERRSIADLVREGVDLLIASRRGAGKLQEGPAGAPTSADTGSPAAKRA